MFGITHILTLDPINIYPAPNVMCIKIDDDPQADITQHFDSTFAYIQKALDDGGKVLVHSREGFSRTTAIVSAYRE
jgi:protein-tyrosine phosphatase